MSLTNLLQSIVRKCCTNYNYCEQKNEFVSYVVDVMTLFKKCISWIAVLLYHRLKLTKTMKNRHRLNPTLFCIGVIHKLACFFKTSVLSTCSIIGVNGRNTKHIYNKALIDSRFYDVEYDLCKRAESYIFKCIVTIPILTKILLPSTIFLAPLLMLTIHATL